MKRLILMALVASSAACAAGTQPGGASAEERVGTTRAADTDDDDDDGPPAASHEAHEVEGIFPHPRWVTTPGGGSGGNTGADGGTGNGASSPEWQPLVNQPVFDAGHAILLTDGSVMVQAAFADPTSSNWDLNSWWKLTPDVNGSYLNGTWTRLASMPGSYAPLWYGSAVLPDGRLIVEGGEYQVQAGQPVSVWQNAGAIYDPVKDQWTSIAPPAGWTFIGDAISTVLADGRFLLSDDWSQAAILDPATLTWTPFASPGKADFFNEEGWTLLPSGQVLTVDTNNFANLTNSEIMTPATGIWTSAGSTIVKLADVNADQSGSWEMGPQVLRPDGTVFAAGGTGHTAIYDVAHGTWKAGPDFPVLPGEGQLDVADGPASLRPDGTVLVVASNGVFEAPAHVFEFDGTNLTQVAEPPLAAQDSSFFTDLLLLPSGEILFTDMSNDVEIYPAPRHAIGRTAPRIQNGCDLEALSPGKTYQLDGVGLNGVSQAVAYGDDLQSATNFPLVRLVNRKTGHVTYTRTHDHSSMSVDGNAASHTSFDVPAGAEAGPSDLVVVANGIASEPIVVDVRAR